MKYLEKPAKEFKKSIKSLQENSKAPQQGLNLEGTQLQSSFANPEIKPSPNKVAKIDESDDSKKFQKQSDDLTNSPEQATKISASQAMSQLKTAYNNNQLARMKHSDEPEKFLTSELKLHDAISDIKDNLLDSDFFGSFAHFQFMNTIVSLLNHENNGNFKFE